MIVIVEHTSIGVPETPLLLLLLEDRTITLEEELLAGEHLHSTLLRHFSWQVSLHLLHDSAFTLSHRKELHTSHS